MTLEEFDERIDQQHRDYGSLVRTFEEFREDSANFFDGSGGAKRIQAIRVLVPDASQPAFDIEYLGRRFSVSFTAHPRENRTIGRLSVYEDDPTNSQNRIKRAECHFTRDGTVEDVEGYDNRGQPLQIGYSRPCNIYVILYFAEKAASL